MQQISFELFDGCNFHCPATGEALIADSPFQPSAATLFAYVDEIADFEFISDEFKAKFDGMETDEDEFESDRFTRFVSEVDEPDTVCFSITQCGMACGPTSITVHIGIRMNQDLEDSAS